jgi:hypothetical protein
MNATTPAPDPLVSLLAIAAALNADPLHAHTTWEADAQQMARLIAQLAESGRLPDAQADEPDEPSECAICVPGQCPGPDQCVGWLGDTR